jgi:hypothetical protein
MTSLQSGRKRVGAALAVMGLAYPLLVYFGIKVLPPGVIVIGLLALIVLQSAIITESSAQRPLLAVSAGAALVVVAIAVSAPLISLKAYPILFSLGLATLFGYSLLRPPTVIERIARLREPDLDEAVSPYLRGNNGLALFLRRQRRDLGGNRNMGQSRGMDALQRADLLPADRLDLHRRVRSALLRPPRLPGNGVRACRSRTY